MAKPLFWWALASAALMVVGGFAPWASVLEVLSVSGTDGGDGWFLIFGGVIAGGLLIVRFVTESRRIWFLVVSLVLALLCVLVSIVDLVDIAGLAEGEGGIDLSDAVSAEWGLYLSLLASISLAAASIAWLVAGRGQAPAQQPATAGAPAAFGAPAASAQPSATPADWYPDPQGQKRLRYWDGAAWTEHTAD